MLRKVRDNVVVYNFGRAGYYSTQERILFEYFVAKGVKPDVAIFLDGLNDFFEKEKDEPDFSNS